MGRPAKITIEHDDGRKRSPLAHAETLYTDTLNALMFEPNVMIVRDACEFTGISERAFFNWVAENEDNLQRYARARSNQMRRFADRLIELGRTATKDNWSAHQLESANIRWLMSKFDPAQFGERLELAVRRPAEVSAEPLTDAAWEAEYGAPIAAPAIAGASA